MERETRGIAVLLRSDGLSKKDRYSYGNQGTGRQSELQQGGNIIRRTRAAFPKMEGCNGGHMPNIDRNEVTALLEEKRKESLAAHRNVVAGAIRECIEGIGQIADAPPEFVMVTPDAKRVVNVEPFFPRGQIGRNVYRCGNCKERVGKHDKYCNECGRRLTD